MRPILFLSHLRIPSIRDNKFCVEPESDVGKTNGRDLGRKRFSGSGRRQQLVQFGAGAAQLVQLLPPAANSQLVDAGSLSCYAIPPSPNDDTNTF